MVSFDDLVHNFLKYRPTIHMKGSCFRSISRKLIHYFVKWIGFSRYLSINYSRNFQYQDNTLLLQNYKTKNTQNLLVIGTKINIKDKNYPKDIIMWHSILWRKKNSIAQKFYFSIDVKLQSAFIILLNF